MDNSFFAYLQQLELLAFFTGYPLVYAVILVFAGNQKFGNAFKGRLVKYLPIAYALVGTLYLGLQIKNLYPDYSFQNISYTIQLPYLMAWGILSMLFWIPALGRKTVFSLIHSLVFFFLIVWNLFQQFSSSGRDNDMVRNYMKLYTVSLLLNLGAILLVVLLSYLVSNFKKGQDPDPAG